MLLDHDRGYDADKIHVVMLVAKDSNSLEELAERLTAAGIPRVVIREPDEPYNGVATAVGVSPTTNRASVQEHLASFKVLR